MTATTRRKSTRKSVGSQLPKETDSDAPSASSKRRRGVEGTDTQTDGSLSSKRTRKSDVIEQVRNRASSPLTPAPEEQVDTPQEERELKAVPPTQKCESEPILSPKLRRAVKHEDHWYLDGSVIVYVDGVIFRLHRSALVRKSTYFANLLGDDGKYAQMGGCPVVEVEGNADDFAALLTAIDDGFGLLSGDVPFRTIAALLRASTLYQFVSIRDWAIAKLEAMWPDNSFSITPLKKPFASESLRLARDCDVPTILKRVLYELVRRGSFGLDVHEGGAGEVLEDESPISYADLCLLISAREHLAQEWISIAACAPERLGTCNANEAHRGDARIWNRFVHKGGIFEERVYDPLVGLVILAKKLFPDEPYHEGAEVGLIRIGWEKADWCPTCYVKMQQSFLNARRKIWDKLDIWFGIA